MISENESKDSKICHPSDKWPVELVSSSVNIDILHDQSKYEMRGDEDDFKFEF